MAKTPEEIRLEKLIQDYKDLTGKKIEFKLQGAQDVLNAIVQMTDAIDAAKSKTDKFRDSFDSILGTVKGILEELGNTTDPIKASSKALQEYKKSVEKIKFDQNNIYKLTKEQVIAEKRKQAASIERLKSQAKEIPLAKQLEGLSQAQAEIEIDKAQKSGQISQEAAEILRAHIDDYKILKQSLVIANAIVETKKKEEKELRNSLGAAAALLGTFGKIPIAGEAAKEAYEKIKREAEATQEAGGKLPSRWENFKKVLKETGGIIKEKLTDPLYVIGGIATLLIKGFNKFDQAVVGVQKRLALSREEAGKLVREFTTFNTLLSSADLLKSIGAIQDKLGSVGKVSRDTAETFARLNTYVGLSEEGAAGLAAQADAFGKNASEVYKTSIATTAQIGKQYKTNINQKAVLEAVGKASAYTLVQFKGSTEALTEGVAKASALGISLETVNKSAQGLLNFQQSIEDELAAEVLSGKQLNLEQARYYALTNQQSKLMDELNGQIGTYSDFTKQTVFAQEAQAKALGMSTTELSDMLFKQEYMKNTAQEQATTEADIIQKRIESLTLQEKLQKATEKISETFANFVAGPLGTFLTDIKTISAIVGFMIGSQLGKMAAGFAPVIAQASAYLGITTATAAATTATATAVSGGTLLPLILGSVGAILGLLAASNADDLFSAGDGSGYGKRVLLAPEGAFALNNNDNIIATTNPIRANDLLSTGKGNLSVNQQPTVISPSNTRINLNLNGAAIGNATAKQDYVVGRNIRAFGGSIDYSAPM